MLKGVEAKTKELNEHVLPHDVKMRPYYDRSDLVDLTTRHGRGQPAARHDAGVDRSGLLPVQRPRGADRGAHHSFGAAVRVHLLHAHDISANLLSIGAIDFGIIMDGAVVMVENIFRELAARAGTRNTS